MGHPSHPRRDGIEPKVGHPAARPAAIGPSYYEPNADVYLRSASSPPGWWIVSVISDAKVQKAVANIKQRSEKQRDTQKSIDSFVDIGLFPQIASDNNQVIYGRRGTGKTHLLNYLRAELVKEPNVRVLFLDCRTLGSSNQFSDLALTIEHRCLALFRDILAEVYNTLLEAIVERPESTFRSPSLFII